MRSLLTTFLLTLAVVIMPSQAASAMSPPNVLVFTGTTGYRHDSIPTSIRVLAAQAERYNVSFDFSEDTAKFNDDVLKMFDAVMFVSATGTNRTSLVQSLPPPL